MSHRILADTHGSDREARMRALNMKLDARRGLAPIFAVVGVRIEIEIDLADVVANPTYLPVLERRNARSS